MTRRVVLDTNVVVSGLLKPQGLEALVLRLALSRQLSLYVSPAVLEEYERVLPKPKLRLTHGEVGRALAEIRSASRSVRPRQVVAESSHGPDNRFLECVEAAKADFLVTGNLRHFPPRWRSARIVSARELLHSEFLSEDF